jgi:hypothetical protein
MMETELMKKPNRNGFWKAAAFAISAATLAALLAIPAHAAKFANQFTEFELPPQWQCNLEGAEWVCQSTNDAKKRDAIIVLAAKLKGDQDSLDQYLQYLKAAKSYTSVQGKPIRSEPRYAKTVNINGQVWVDSLHLESEIPSFYTRYLATVKQDIGVLVTYSINKDKYKQYLQDFEAMVQTLKVFRKAGGINAAPANTDLFKNTQIPAHISENTVYPDVNPAGGGEGGAPKPRDGGDLPMLPLLAGGAVVLYILWRRRQNQG